MMNIQATPKLKAYSYIRFSTPEQERGDSLRRQSEAAVRYAAVHGLELDEKLTFQDLGVSAFTGANEESGQLGDFLQAVHHGDIPKGSYLLVESLDRLSRQPPRKAVRVLERICEAGIRVVTLDDGREYTEETFNEDFISLLVALMVAARAHEESAKKGRRVGAAWANKRDHARTDNKPLTALCPGWLRLNSQRSGFEVIGERAEVVRRIFDGTLRGVGQHSLAETLNREGVPVFGRGKMWQRSYINKILGNPAVIGTFTPHRTERINGKRVRISTDPIQGYFPAIVEPETFERVAAMISARPPYVQSPVVNILAGLARCPICEATMTRVNKGYNSKGGKPYLVCTRAKVGAGCDYRQVRLEDVEVAIIQHAEELLGSMPSPTAGLQARWEELMVHRDVSNEEIERLVEAVARSGQSKALLERLRKAERELDLIVAQLDEVEGKIADSLTNRVQHTVKEFVVRAQRHNRSVAEVNATLRQLFSKVVVDYREGYLCFYWRHADGEISEIIYSMAPA